MTEQQIAVDLIEFARTSLATEVVDTNSALKLESLSIFTLVGFIENKWGVSLHDRELTVENFANVASVAKLVANKVASR